MSKLELKSADRRYMFASMSNYFTADDLEGFVNFIIMNANEI